MTTDPTTTAALGLEPTYSAQEAAAFLGRSYSWLDQRLRAGQFVLSDGTTVQPLRTPGGYRRFTLQMLRDIIVASARHGWFSVEDIFEDAVKTGLARANDTLRGVKSAWIKEQVVDVENGGIVAYRVNMLVTFVLE